jgi:hypothetical protein
MATLGPSISVGAVIDRLKSNGFAIYDLRRATHQESRGEPAEERSGRQYGKIRD